MRTASVAIGLIAVTFLLASCSDQHALTGPSEAPASSLREQNLEQSNPDVVAAVRILSFSGHDWWVKSSSGRVGPGPNYFSDSPNNVWVDGTGRLHLKITKRKGHWYCAEVVSVESFGYGTYRFYLDSPVDNFDPYVVLGLFTWNDDTAYTHRENDVEFSRWGSANNQNAQYVVQPYTLPQNIHRFQQPSGLSQSTHSFLWQSSSVFFQSLKGLIATPPDQSYVIQEWTCTNQIPRAGGENARMNLWLFRGRPPSNGQGAEVIVNKFEVVQ